MRGNRAFWIWSYCCWLAPHRVDCRWWVWCRWSWWYRVWIQSHFQYWTTISCNCTADNSGWSGRNQPQQVRRMTALLRSAWGSSPRRRSWSGSSSPSSRTNSIVAAGRKNRRCFRSCDPTRSWRQTRNRLSNDDVGPTTELEMWLDPPLILHPEGNLEYNLMRGFPDTWYDLRQGTC